MARAKSKFKEDQTDTKLRGGYYTPDKVADYLSRWVLHNKPVTILEPSCGDGQFLRALAIASKNKISVTAVELNRVECKKAADSVSNAHNLSIDYHCADFLGWGLKSISSKRQFDAVLGNPPYIRYQYLDDPFQKASGAIFDMFDLKFTKHTNAWVPFVIASVALLAPGGRLGMVIPSELIHVLHATSLRRFLTEVASKILVIDPVELLFDDALQGTVLLMVEKKSRPSSKGHGVCIKTHQDNSFLGENPEIGFAKSRFVGTDFPNGKWTTALLSASELEVIKNALELPAIHRFSDVASVDVGMVTGANDFFLVDKDTLKKYELERYAKPMFGRGGHCPGIIYDDALHLANAERGLPCNFLDFNALDQNKISKAVRDYIAVGENQDLHRRYKCRIRSPWYAVPSVYATEIGMLKRSHHFPKLIHNPQGALTTDTAYRIKSLGNTAESLVHGFINSLTALSAELEGRSYGGGVLEMVPSEIERLIVPVLNEKNDMRALDEAVRNSSDPDLLLTKQDRLVLTPAGLSKHDVTIIQAAYKRIRHRRQREATVGDRVEAA